MMKADESFAKAELQLAQRIKEIYDPDFLRRTSEIAMQTARQIEEISHSIIGPDQRIVLERTVAAMGAGISEVVGNRFEQPLPENLYRSIMSFQVAELARINQLASTAMLEELQRHLTRNDYTAYINTISEALQGTLLDAADMSYLKGLRESKSSPMGSQVLESIDIPSGLKTQLDDIHVHTANRLAKSEDINYNLKTKQFVISEEPDKTSTVEEMNSLSSAAAMFDTVADEKEYITEHELIDFMNLLETAQSRASLSATGRKIDTLIRDVAERIGFDRGLFYHGRMMADSKACPYTNAQMLAAPTGVPGPGRFNNPGRAYYYFADTLEGSRAELRKHDKKNRIQTVVLKPRRDITMIDLSGTLRNAKMFLKYIRFQLDDHSVMPRVYLIPNYVSDCCREHGIEGIKYYGSKKYSNYVTWQADYFDFVDMILEAENDVE